MCTIIEEDIDVCISGEFPHNVPRSFTATSLARHCIYCCDNEYAQLTSYCMHVQEEGVANRRGRRTPANHMRSTSKKNQKKSIVKKEEEKLPGTSAAHYSLVQALMTQHSWAPPPPRLTMFMKVKEPPAPPPQQEQAEVASR